MKGRRSWSASDEYIDPEMLYRGMTLSVGSDADQAAHLLNCLVAVAGCMSDPRFLDALAYLVRDPNPGPDARPRTSAFRQVRADLSALAGIMRS